MATEITPAEISEEMALKCQSITAEIYDVLDCRGLVRIDFIINKGEFYF
ncbi:unnamed protein product, partial [marine sediment metagenome]